MKIEGFSKPLLYIDTIPGFLIDWADTNGNRLRAIYRITPTNYSWKYPFFWVLKVRTTTQKYPNKRGYNGAYWDFRKVPMGTATRSTHA